MGYRYIFTADDKAVVQVEFYEYDLDNLNDKAKEVLTRAKEQGTMQVLEDQECDAYVSDNGKYLMLYIDASENENNMQRREKVIELFKGME